MKILFTILLLFYIGNLHAKTGEVDRKANYKPVLNVVKQKLGNQTIAIKVYSYGPLKDIVFIHLHGNENTSLLSGMQWLKANGGLLIKIENSDNRNIAFKIDSALFQFDPNHIFSIYGIKKDFENNTTNLTKAISETQQLAKKILSLIPANPSLIVALHNNFDGDFSINSYLKGNERAIDALKVFKNPEKDADDIFLTTDATLYKQLSGEGFNTILQNAKTVKKDGSLSVYFHEKKVPYLNCETEHGKQGVYLQMLTSALKNIERKNGNERLVNYTCLNDSGILQKGMPIYIDSTYAGALKSVYHSKTDSSTTGKFSWPLKMGISDTLELSPSIEVNGRIFLRVQNNMKSLKNKELRVILKINFIKTELELPAKEIADSTIQN